MTHTDRAPIPTASERPTLTVWPEAAAILGLCKASAYAAAERGEIPTIRVGRRLLVPTAALRRMLQIDPERCVETDAVPAGRSVLEGARNG